MSQQIHLSQDLLTLTATHGRSLGNRTTCDNGHRFKAVTELAEAVYESGFAVDAQFDFSERIARRFVDV